MKASSITVALAAVTLHLPALAQTSSVMLRAKAAPGEQVMFVLSLGRGPAVRIPGVEGVIRLDTSFTVVVPGGPLDAHGVSEAQFQVPQQLPEQALHCQAVRLSSQGITIGRRSQPLVDRREALIERTLPLGNNLGGQFLFDLDRQDIVAVVRHYFGAAADPAPVLAQMRRPLHRVMDGDEAGEVGMEGACRLLHETWRLALAQTPLPAIDQAVDQMSETLGDALFQSRFPNGVNPNDEYWDGVSLDTWTESSASALTSADYGISVTASISHTSLGWSVKGKGTTKAYSRVTGTTSWTKCDVYKVKIEGDFMKDGSAATMKSLYDYDYYDWSVSDSASFSDSPFASHYYELDVTGTIQVTSTSSPYSLAKHQEGSY